MSSSIRCTLFTLFLVGIGAEWTSAQAQQIDSLMGRVDAAEAAHIQQMLVAANAGLPPTTPVRTAAGRLIASRSRRPAAISTRDLNAAIDFIADATYRDHAFALSRLQGQGLALGIIEDAISWIALAVTEEHLSESEAAMGSTHRAELELARRQMTTELQARRVTTTDVRSFRTRFIGRRTTSDRVSELWSVDPQTPVSPRDIVIVAPRTTGGR